MDVNLKAVEVAELDKQDPATARNGGYQSLMVSLARRVDRPSWSAKADHPRLC